jgi:hypothetical protein
VQSSLGCVGECFPHAGPGRRKNGVGRVSFLWGCQGVILLLSGATKTADRLNDSRIGALISPRSGNSIERFIQAGRPWAADNDAFLAWDEKRFEMMLDRIRRASSPPLWVACPDVVADARATLDRFEVWFPRMSDLPVAIVAQNGLEDLDVPWSQLAGLFIGGCTDWKLSWAAADLVSEANRRGIWTHMGRVNTARRIRHAFTIGCKSFDGTGWSMYPDTLIPKAIRCLTRHEMQPELF